MKNIPKKVASINFITIEFRQEDFSDNSSILKELHYRPEHFCQACEMYSQLESEEYSEIKMFLTIEYTYAVEDSGLQYIMMFIPQAQASLIAMCFRSFCDKEEALPASMSDEEFYNEFSL